METEPSNPLKEIFDELFGLLESLEAQSMAVTQFLKEQKVGNDKKLAPYLEQAGNASSVKWRAARARMQYLLSPAPKQTKDEEKDKNKEPEKPPSEKPSEVKQPTGKQSAENCSTEQSKPTGSNAAKDATQNTKTNRGEDQKPAAEEDPKKSEPRQNSNTNS